MIDISPKLQKLASKIPKVVVVFEGFFFQLTSLGAGGSQARNAKIEDNRVFFKVEERLSPENCRVSKLGHATYEFGIGFF